jgi:hypothetical protein
VLALSACGKSHNAKIKEAQANVDAEMNKLNGAEVENQATTTDPVAPNGTAAQPAQQPTVQQTAQPTEQATEQPATPPQAPQHAKANPKVEPQHDPRAHVKVPQVSAPAKATSAAAAPKTAAKPADKTAPKTSAKVAPKVAAKPAVKPTTKPLKSQTVCGEKGADLLMRQVQFAKANDIIAADLKKTNEANAKGDIVTTLAGLKSIDKTLNAVLVSCKEFKAKHPVTSQLCRGSETAKLADGTKAACLNASTKSKEIKAAIHSAETVLAQTTKK